MSRAMSCGRHMRQQPAEPFAAIGGVGFRPVDEHLLGGGISRDVVRPAGRRRRTDRSSARAPRIRRRAGRSRRCCTRAATPGLRPCATSPRALSPVPPGPPGLTSRIPCCWLASARWPGIHVSARVIVPAAGFARSRAGRSAWRTPARPAGLADRAGMPVQRADYGPGTRPRSAAGGERSRRPRARRCSRPPNRRRPRAAPPARRRRSPGGGPRPERGGWPRRDDRHARHLARREPGLPAARAAAGRAWSAGNGRLQDAGRCGWRSPPGPAGTPR